MAAERCERVSTTNCPVALCISFQLEGKKIRIRGTAKELHLVKDTDKGNKLKKKNTTQKENKAEYEEGRDQKSECVKWLSECCT